LPKDKENALDDLAKVTFLDTRGEEQRLLTDEEHAYLSIPRGSLSHEEFEKIKSHARKTDEFLSKIPWGDSLKNIPFIASSHHERLDGSGYPRRLLDAQIPLKAKMMAIADIYDALTASDRPYKKAVPVERALAILHDEVKKGGLDEELVKLFVECRVFDRESYHDAEPVGADEP
jgi:HD-GYP domain-containing protein (c-di-GMP phosphodiesterase class II)